MSMRVSTSIDVAEADYMRFKAFCAARRTTMQAEMRAFIEQQIADPAVCLTESFLRAGIGRAEGLCQASSHQLRELGAIETFGYFAEWEDAPGVPVFILGTRIRPVGTGLRSGSKAPKKKR
jgi:hypothetical protein